MSNLGILSPGRSLSRSHADMTFGREVAANFADFCRGERSKQIKGTLNLIYLPISLHPGIPKPAS